MMTTMAALLGALPIARGFGAGGEARAPARPRGQSAA
jgi:multidrug efflux pump subunit AcrB